MKAATMVAMLLVMATRLLQATNRKTAISKTFQNTYGDVVDCIDIYQQSAFDHPLLRDHVIPQSLLVRGSTQNQSELCPFGTIPKLRSNNRSNHFIHPKIKTDNQGSKNARHEHSVVYEEKGKYIGSLANISVWNPNTVGDDFSLSQIWLVKNSHECYPEKTVEAGWIVSPQLYNDTKTRLFIYWTSNCYKEELPCYNDKCPGFVSTSAWFYLGFPLHPISKYHGVMKVTEFFIYKDPLFLGWVLKVQKELVGYWPGLLLNISDGSFDLVEFGGEIYNSNLDGIHTRTEMGSGHFPKEGFGGSCFIKDMFVISDDEKNVIHKLDLQTLIERPECYDGHLDDSFFYFGGPGYIPGKCT